MGRRELDGPDRRSRRAPDAIDVGQWISRAPCQQSAPAEPFAASQLALHLHVDPYPQNRVEEFDVTFMAFNEGFDANIVARKIGSMEWIVCACPAYFKHRGAPERPGQLHRQTHLRFLWQAASDHASQSIRLRKVDGGEEDVEVNLRAVLQS